MKVKAKKHVPAQKEAKKANLSTTKYYENRIVCQVFILITCLKLLLIPTYHSTDFEVHRNWLAITHNLPVKEWYTSAKSQWTLDYPPLFAWFEYLLSCIAQFVDPEMLEVDNFNYASSNTVLFQRGTVIVLDLIFAYGAKIVGTMFCSSSDSYVIFVILSLCNVGLLVVDHIHFQYNGFLLGILLIAIAKVSKVNDQASVLQGALCFAILLNLKHIYLYIAPVFIVWLLRSYCMNGGRFIKRFFMLGIIVMITLAISFGPFVSQLPQVLSRLFPFKRGLVHAYWAANAWSLYIGVDKAIALISNRLGWINTTKSAVMTGGLVQEQSLLVLPTPTPLITFLLTLLAMLPILYCFFSRKEYSSSRKQFVRGLVLCALCSFMFGWHVHEKAILTAIIPLCILAVTDKNDARVFLILNSAGHTGLLPLLYPKNLTPLKILLLLTYMVVSFLTLSRKFKQQLLHLHEYIYVVGLPILTIYETMLHKIIFGEQLPFLPLALTSIYCAIGVSYSWILYYHMFLKYKNINEQSKKEE